MPDEVQSPPDSSSDNWIPLTSALVLSTISSIAIYGVAGDTLSLFIAGPLVAAMLVPSLVAPIRSRIDTLIATAAIVFPISIVWLMPIFHVVISLAHWIPAMLVLSSFALAAAGLTRLLARFLVPAVASTLITLALLAWLTWPVWLSPRLASPAGDRAVGWLSPAHPLFAINAAVHQRLGIWSEQPVAYTLTNLGQDVQYVLPYSVNLAVVIHLCASAGLALRSPRESVTPRQ